jgi:hypothetical protein
MYRLCLTLRVAGLPEVLYRKIKLGDGSASAWEFSNATPIMSRAWAMPCWSLSVSKVRSARRAVAMALALSPRPSWLVDR